MATIFVILGPPDKMIRRIYSSGKNFLKTIMMEGPPGPPHSSLFMVNILAFLFLFLFLLIYRQSTLNSETSFVFGKIPSSLCCKLLLPSHKQTKDRVPSVFKPRDKVWLSSKYIQACSTVPGSILCESPDQS